jgi:protein-disulfide isomerase
VAKFKADMEAPETAAQVTAEMKEAGDVGVRGTPSFFINGKQPAGRSFELYKSIIDEEIKAKKKA